MAITAPAVVRHTRRLPHESLVLGVILASQLMVVLDATIVNVALPAIQQDLHFSDTGLSWVLNAYALTFGGLLLLGARAGDLLGRRRVFVAGLSVFTAASLLGGFAPTSETLLAARALQGIGAAVAAPSSLALLTTMFSDGAARMRALGLFTAVSVSGGALGLLTGGMLTEWASWRWTMFVNVPIGIVVIALGRSVLPETDRHPGRFDLAGALTSTLGMSSLVYGFVRAAAAGWTDPATMGAFVAGLVLLAVFVRVELTADEPITPLRLLADPSRTGANVARGLQFAGMFGLFFFLTQFMQEVLGYSALQAGLAFLPMPTTVFVMSQLTTKVLLKRYNGKVLMLSGMTLATSGFLLASQLTPSSSYWHVLVCLLLFAVGNGTSFVPLTSAALADVPPADAGAASGLVNVTQQLGGALGVSILVTVFGHFARLPKHGLQFVSQEQFQTQFTTGVTHAFLGAAMFLATALTLVAVAVKAPNAARA
jgi:EmrB/QacA subfamily drug resistance transporter